MKKNKGLIVLVIVLLVFLLGALGFIYYGYTKYDETTIKYNDTKSKLEEANKNLKESKEEAAAISENNYIVYKDNEIEFKVYAEGYRANVIGYDDELYILEHNGVGSGTKINCITEISKGAKFEKNVYSCKDNEYKNEEDMDAIAYKLDITEKDVSEVLIRHLVGATDATYITFVIYNSGKVDVVTADSDSGVNKESEFKEYKVKDIEKYYGENCTPVSDATKKCKIIAVLKLQDGSIKEVQMN